MTSLETQPRKRAGVIGERAKLVIFYSPTSGSCRRAEGYLAEVLQRRRNHDTLQILRVNADRNRDLVDRFDIATIPTLVVIDDNHVRGRLAAPKGCHDIKRLLSPWLR